MIVGGKKVWTVHTKWSTPKPVGKPKAYFSTWAKEKARTEDEPDKVFVVKKVWLSYNLRSGLYVLMYAG